jgi:hypothetical protein
MDLLITDHLTFTDEHKRLLTAQVVLTETVQQLAEAQKRNAEAQRRTDEQMKLTEEQIKRTDERLKALAEAQNVMMQILDDLIRKRPSL